jgi:hypothetical protein
MDDVLGGLFISVATGFAVVGIFFTFGDVRTFDDIIKDCKEQGYVQNNKARVLCSIEVKK